MAVYFIRNNRTGSYKIGYSEEPTQRLLELQTGNEEELLLELVIPGDLSLERHLHAMWDSLRLRGEWFSSSEGLLSFIEQMRTLGAVSEYGQTAVDTLLWFAEFGNQFEAGNRWRAAWLRSLGAAAEDMND